MTMKVHKYDHEVNGFMTTCYDPLNDGISELKLQEYIGGELSIVNRARCSYNCESTELSEKDLKLLEYLITANPMHRSPLYGTVMTFKVKMPLFVRNQWWKHHVASNFTEDMDAWNEVSFRYKQISPEYYMPKVLRTQHKVNKQCSGEPLSQGKHAVAECVMEGIVKDSFKSYEELLRLGVSREQASRVLPTCTYTTVIWTVSLYSVLNFLELRNHPAAQDEIKQYAACLGEVIEELFPHVYKYWTLSTEVNTPNN